MYHVSLDKKQSIVACTIGHDILMTQGREGWENNCIRKQTKAGSLLPRWNE